MPGDPSNLLYRRPDWRIGSRAAIKPGNATGETKRFVMAVFNSQSHSFGIKSHERLFATI
jgi:hypothetical protein